MRFLRWAMIPISALPFLTRTDIQGHVALSVSLEVLGYLLLVAGVGLRLWSTLYIGSRKSRELIQQGPYSMCRNPLYLGTFAIIMGVALLFDNLVMLAAIVLLFVPIMLLVIRLEERHLEEIFGQEYCNYRLRVPALWPSLRNYSNPERLEVATRAVTRASIESAAILLVPPLAEITKFLYSNHWLPVLWAM